LKRQCLHLSLATIALGISLLLLIPATSPARARGIDVSRFQGKIDWDRVAETNIEFAFIQGSRGSGHDCAVVPERCGADEFYGRNYRRARAAGIRVGAYHRAFADGDGRKEAKSDARAEARLFLEQVGAFRRGDLLPALDVESPFGGLNSRRLRVWLRTWLRRVEEALGVKPLIYTNYSSWQETGDTSAFAQVGHRLWIANYGVDEPLVPAEDWAGERWSIWQFTSNGKVAGIEGPVDKNRLRVALGEISVP
jgi:lysozyme